MTEPFVGLGLLGLAAAAFLAGSVVPLPSEAVLAAVLVNGVDPVLSVGVASLANTVGAATLLWLGRGGRVVAERRLGVAQRGRLERAQAHVGRFGAVALVLAWLPIVGDVFVLAAGVLRIPWGPALAAIAVGKTARYAAVAWGLGAM